MFDLERWLFENAAPCRFFMPEQQDEKMVPVDAVRELFAGKVLCDAEPAITRPSGDRAERRDDMSSTGVLIVGLDADNDVCVSVVGAPDEGYPTVEFCNAADGGGKSPRTRAALIALMVAMEQDAAAQEDDK